MKALRTLMTVMVVFAITVTLGFTPDASAAGRTTTTHTYTT